MRRVRFRPAAALVLATALTACRSPCAPECIHTLGTIACAANSARVGPDHHQRRVLWQVPAGDPPDTGWPVVLLFQGSLAPAQTYWSGFSGEPLGGLHAVELTEDLLSDGFAVFTPEAVVGGFWCWNTNVPPWADDFSDSPDKAVLDALFEGMDAGDFGPLDTSHMFAAGISSGGYMTSRMAEAYPGRFSALAVISGSWATCLGPFCTLPDTLPADHPPTFFGHGQLDPIVPIGTMHKYEDALDAAGVETDELVSPDTLHAWFEGEADAIDGWFLAH